MENKYKMPCEAQATFKYEGAGRFLVMLCVVYTIFSLTIFEIERTRHGPMHLPEIILLIMFLFLLYIFYFAIKGISDIIISQSAISRRLFGWTMQTIYWSNVKRISVDPFYHAGLQRMVRQINIHPIVKDRFRAVPAGSLAFTDNVQDIQKLISLLNSISNNNNIILEAVDKGISRRIPSL